LLKVALNTINWKPKPTSIISHAYSILPTNNNWRLTLHTSPWEGFELTTLVMIGTDCTGSSTCKSNYHPIMSMTAPNEAEERLLYFFIEMNVTNVNIKMILMSWLSEYQK
jgi:hypothetical protein